MSLINWWAVLAVTALNMFIGFLWYGPIWGRLYLKASPMTAEDRRKGATPFTYLLPLLGALVSALVLAMVLANLRIFTWWSGAAWGALLWFAFGATGLLTTGTFEGYNRGLSWLFIGYMVIVHAIGGAIFAVWR